MSSRNRPASLLSPRRLRKTVPRHPAAPAAIESLEDRVLLAVTLLIDYSLDNGFFNSAERRAAIEAVASEIGSRLNDTLAAIPTGSYAVTNPQNFQTTTRTFSVPANAIRVYVSGASLGGSVVGQGGWRTNTGIRNFNASNDFQPYVGYVSFDSDGSTAWNFGLSGPGTNFRIVARHELLHVLGIGGARTWDAFISASNTFTGPKTRAVNGGINPAVDGSHGHFAQGVNSIMTPVVGGIPQPTAVDWAALDDIGWDVVTATTPGLYADLIGRTANGTWYLAANSNGSLSGLSVMDRWNEAAGWRDVMTGDFDGNGLTDVIGRTAAGGWWVGLNRGGTFVSQVFGMWDPTFNWRDVRVGDFNNDGRDDIAGRTSFGSWYVGISTGAVFATTGWAGWNEAANWRDARVGDFNGDGRDDIVARTSGGVWYAALSTGSGFTTAAWSWWNAAANWRGTVVADFNGDGRGDIASRTSGGAWYVALSTGSSFTTALWAIWNEAAGWRDVRIGDFTGDARPDILSRTSRGVWYVGTSNGTSFVTAPFGMWNEAAGWRDLIVAQFAGSTKFDVMARTSGGAWYVGETVSSTLRFRFAGMWAEAAGWRSVHADRNFVTAAASSAPVAAAGLTDLALPAETSLPAATAESTEAFVNHLPNEPRAILLSVQKDKPAPAPANLAAAYPLLHVTDEEDLIDLFEDVFSDTELLDALTAA